MKLLHIECCKVEKLFLSNLPKTTGNRIAMLDNGQLGQFSNFFFVFFC